MCDPKFCSMQISQEVRAFATKPNQGVEGRLATGPTGRKPWRRARRPRSRAPAASCIWAPGAGSTINSTLTVDRKVLPRQQIFYGANGGLIEDIAFERAIEGTEQEVLNAQGDVIATRLVHDNRLLKYLLSHLKPERYGDRARGAPPQGTAEPETAGTLVLDESLRAMEPALPAPPEQLLDPDTLADELQLADLADGALPTFLGEQRAPKSDARRAMEEAEARDARGAAALKKDEAGGDLTDEEFADECFHLDPTSNPHPPSRRRQGT